MNNYTYTSLNFLRADGDFVYALRLPGMEGLYVRRLEAEDFRGESSYAPARRAVTSTGPYSSPPKR